MKKEGGRGLREHTAAHVPLPDPDCDHGHGEQAGCGWEGEGEGEGCTPGSQAADPGSGQALSLGFLGLVSETMGSGASAELSPLPACRCSGN